MDASKRARRRSFAALRHPVLARAMEDFILWSNARGIDTSRVDLRVDPHTAARARYKGETLAAALAATAMVATYLFAMYFCAASGVAAVGAAASAQARIEAERRRDPRYRVQQQQQPYGQPGYGQPRYRPRTY